MDSTLGLYGCMWSFFGFQCLKYYTIQFPNRVRRIVGMGNVLRGELLLRRLPIAKLGGGTIVGLFAAK